MHKEDKERFTCPVCGYSGLNEPPYDATGLPSHEICPSCVTQFGYDDAKTSHRELRRLWIENGAKWWSEVRDAPPNWDPFEQMENAGLSY